MDLDMAVDSDLVFEATVGFSNDRRKAPASVDLDFLDEVDAISNLDMSHRTSGLGAFALFYCCSMDSKREFTQRKTSRRQPD